MNAKVYYSTFYLVTLAGAAISLWILGQNLMFSYLYMNSEVYCNFPLPEECGQVFGSVLLLANLTHILGLMGGASITGMFYTKNKYRGSL